MASKASLRAYCALGCCYWFGEEIRSKHGKENETLTKASYLLQQEANKTANLWEDALTKKQVRKIQKEFKNVFENENEDALRVGSMLLTALEDMKEFVKPKKREALDRVIAVLSKLVQEHYDTDGNEWSIYESSFEALERFNAMIERI